MTQGNSTNTTTFAHFLCLLLICAVGAAISLPMAQSNTQFLYAEDDAHHFNRTVEMAKRKTLDPAYFNKPALHFYTRMPAIYLAVLLSKATDHPISLREIRTRDPYGLAGFSFTPSHPSIVFAVRLVTIALTIALAWLAYLTLTTVFKVPPAFGFAGSLLTLVSPEILANSYIIGVDTLMGVTTLCTVYFTLKACHSWNKWSALTSATLAGLACASKYNAAPILIVPALYWWTKNRSLKGALIMCCGVGAGFFIGAPYSFLSWSDFIAGISYEAWHYGIAGHADHTIDRGLPHLAKIAAWILSDGIGRIGLLFAIFGIGSLFKKMRTESIIFLAYPLCFILMMSSQKVFFARNMLSIVGFCSVAATLGVWQSCGFIQSAYKALGFHQRNKTLSYALQLALFIAITTPLLTRSNTYRKDALFVEDSRLEAQAWINFERPLSRDVAVDGELLLPIKLFSIPGVDAFNAQRQSIIDLIQKGYEYFIVPTSADSLDPVHTEIIKSIPGSSAPWRIPKSPAISILRAKPRAHLVETAPAHLTFKYKDTGIVSSCSADSTEPYCWITTVTSELSFVGTTADYAYLEVMSPWVNQKITIRAADGTTVSSVKLRTPSRWETLPLPLSKSNSTTTFQVVVSQVHSPESQGLSSDPRRLGVAVRPTMNPS